MDCIGDTGLPAMERYLTGRDNRLLAVAAQLAARCVSFLRDR